MEPVMANPESVAAAIQLAVAPVFLLTGIAGLLNVMAHRLGRVIDRARAIESSLPTIPSARRSLADTDLDILGRRMLVAQWAIAMCVLSALLVCIVVAVLFVGELTPIARSAPVALLFIVATGLLIIGLLLFLYEIHLALRSVRIRGERVG